MPVRVLHVTAVERENYYLNNLAAYLPRSLVSVSFATIGFDQGFVTSLERSQREAHALRVPARSKLLFAAYRLARLARATRPHVLHAHEFDCTLIAVVVGRLLGCRVVRTRHYSDAIQRLQNPAKRFAYAHLEAWMNARVRRIIVPARRVLDIMVQSERVEPQKLSLIPYGQTRDRFDAVSAEQVARARASLGRRERPLLVYVARLHAEKGHRHLLEALAQLVSEGFPGTLCLVGTGPEQARLQARARALGIGDRVSILGWRDDALAIAAAADLVVHPSLHEALPSAVIEALALGRPVVASDVSGVRDVLGDSEFGIVIPPGDVQALLGGLRAGLADLEAWQGRARRGAARLFDQMDPARCARLHADIYLAEGGAPDSPRSR